MIVLANHSYSLTFKTWMWKIQNEFCENVNGKGYTESSPGEKMSTLVCVDAYFSFS